MGGALRIGANGYGLKQDHARSASYNGVEPTGRPEPIYPMMVKNMSKPGAKPQQRLSSSDISGTTVTGSQGRPLVSSSQVVRPRNRSTHRQAQGPSTGPGVDPLGPRTVPRKIEETAPLELTLKSAQDLSYRERQLTPGEAAKVLRVSVSWLAKARMRGDGPPFGKFGRSVRYGEGALVQWIKSCRRLSTSER